MADFPGDVSRICQHRADALMEICPELLKDNVVQKKKVEIRSPELPVTPTLYVAP